MGQVESCHNIQPGVGNSALITRGARKGSKHIGCKGSVYVAVHAGALRRYGRVDIFYIGPGEGILVTPHYIDTGF